MPRRRPELTVAAYLLLAAAAWAWDLASEPHDWRRAFVFLAVWAIAAVGLVLRKRLGLVFLLIIELLSLYSWVEEPGNWLRFCVQVALVFLLLSPPMDRYAPLGPPASPQRESRMSVILIGGSIVGALLVWGAVEAMSGDAAAIPLLTMACVFSVPLWRVERASDRNEAGGHP